MRFPGAIRDDRGATAVEYGLIAALIAVVILVAVALLGGNLGALFTGSASALANEGSPDPCSTATASGDPLPTCNSLTGAWSCPTGYTLAFANSEYTCVASAPVACPARPLGEISVPKHTGPGNGTFSYNIISGVTGGQLASAAKTSGDGSIGFTSGGSITWTYPSGNRSAVISFSYSGTGCSGGSGSVTLDAD